MATVSAFPTPDQGGPVINRQVNVTPDYKVINYDFDSGARRSNVTPCGPMRFQLEYQGLTEAEAAIIDAHFDLAKGKTNDFSFYDERTGHVYTGVRYEAFGKGQHQRYFVQSRTITLFVED